MASLFLDEEILTGNARLTIADIDELDKEYYNAVLEIVAAYRNARRILRRMLIEKIHANKDVWLGDADNTEIFSHTDEAEALRNELDTNRRMYEAAARFDEGERVRRAVSVLDQMIEQYKEATHE